MNCGKNTWGRFPSRHFASVHDFKFQERVAWREKNLCFVCGRRFYLRLEGERTADELKRKNIVAIHSPNLFPSFSLFDKLCKASTWVIYDTQAYTRGGFINRNMVSDGGGKGGKEWITWPIAHEYKGRSLSCIPWSPDEAGSLWRSIERRYKNSKYWLVHCEEIKRIVYTPRKRFVQMTAEYIKYVLFLLKINITVKYASEIAGEKKPGETASGYLNRLCVGAGADKYLSGASGENYLDVNELTVTVSFHKFRGSTISSLHYLFNSSPRQMKQMVSRRDIFE